MDTQGKGPVLLLKQYKVNASTQGAYGHYTAPGNNGERKANEKMGGKQGVRKEKERGGSISASKKNEKEKKRDNERKREQYRKKMGGGGTSGHSS